MLPSTALKTLFDSPFAQAQSLLATQLKAVDVLIFKKLTSQSVLISKVSNHIIGAGGKRLRPMLTLLSARLCGYQRGHRHIALATCIEFIHTATLLHDDVVDDSDQRRGNPTAQMIWGNTASILVGDFLFSRAFELMVEDGSLDVLKTLSQAATKIAQGEILQLELNANLRATMDDYIRVIECKTAALFEAATSIGGIITDRTTEEIYALRQYGYYLGLIFQLVDDLLDYVSTEKQLGKPTGGDFHEGKLTLPVILSLSKATLSEYAFWQRTLAYKDQQPGDWEKAVEILKGHDIQKDIDDYTDQWAKKAQESLGIFPDSPEKSLLVEMVYFSRARVF